MTTSPDSLKEETENLKRSEFLLRLLLHIQEAERKLHLGKVHRTSLLSVRQICINQTLLDSRL
jgi:hypothetical protein